MNYAVSTAEYKQIKKLQQIYDVTLISDKGYVFLDQDDWGRICGQLSSIDEAISHSHIHGTLADATSFWSECFLVAYDSSEDFSCHSVCNADFFMSCCHKCGIYPVLVPTGYDLTHYVTMFNGHSNNDAMGCYVPSRGDVLIKIEDN